MNCNSHPTGLTVCDAKTFLAAALVLLVVSLSASVTSMGMTFNVLRERAGGRNAVIAANVSYVSFPIALTMIAIVAALELRIN